MASRHPSQQFYSKQVAEQYQYGTKISVGQRGVGAKQVWLRLSSTVTLAATELGVFSFEGLQPQTHCISSKAISFQKTRREGLSLVHKCSSSVVELSLLVDWRRCRYEQGFGRDVRFERGGPADNSPPVWDVLLLSVVAVLACQVSIGDEGVVNLAGAARGVHSCQEWGRLMGPTVSLAETVLARNHSTSNSASIGHLVGCRDQRMPLGGMSPLQRGLVVGGNVRRNIHASGEAVSR